MEKIITVDRLKKSYGNVKAVNDISFYVEEGSLFSFLGTNGAGKSTTISIILTLLEQDAGSVQVNGFNVGEADDQIRKEIGVVFQDSLMDPLLTVQENLDVRGSFYGMTKIERYAAIEYVAKITDLMAFLNRPYGKLSGGERRRTDIARALIHKPNILILDEPTTGLDAHSREKIWQTILKLQTEQKMTVFLTTHYIEEAAESDFVVVMNEGVIVAKGTPEQLKNNYSSHKLIMTTDDPKKMEKLLQADQYDFTQTHLIFQLPLKCTTEAIPILEKYRTLITSFEVKKSSLDDVFLRITRRENDSDVSIY